MGNSAKISYRSWELLERGIELAQEIESTSPLNRRWIAIYNLKKIPARPGTWIILRSRSETYCIVDFEVEIQALEHSDGVSNLINQKVYYANSSVELYDLLYQLTINPEKFVASFDCSYPL